MVPSCSLKRSTIENQPGYEDGSIDLMSAIEDELLSDDNHKNHTKSSAIYVDNLIIDTANYTMILKKSPRQWAAFFKTIQYVVLEAIHAVIREHPELRGTDFNKKLGDYLREAVEEYLQVKEIPDKD